MIETGPPAPRVVTATVSKPGQRGTKRLVAEYGDRLVCVRYRYPLPCPVLSPDRLVAVRMAYAELEVRRQVEEADGSWNPDRKVWARRYDRAVAPGARQPQRPSPSRIAATSESTTR